MDDHHLTLDELVSSYIDGETTPEQATQMSQDPAYVSRLEEMTTVRDAVAAPVAAPTPDQQDRIIAAALASAHETRTQGDRAGSDDATVVPLRRERRWQSPLLLAAAAIVLIAAVVGAALLSDTTDESITYLASDSPDMAADEAMASAEMDDASVEEAPAEFADDGAADDVLESFDAESASAEEWMAEAEAQSDFADEEADIDSDDATMSADGEVLLAEPESEMGAMMSEAEPASEGEEELVATGIDTSAATEATELALSGAEEARQIIDLGVVENLDALMKLIGDDLSQDDLSQQAADVAEGQSIPACATVLDDHIAAEDLVVMAWVDAVVEDLSSTSIRVAIVDHDDGVSAITAVEPDCELHTHTSHS